MISIRKRFLFIHVPKTAGNSIQNILSKHSEDKIVTDNNLLDGKERFRVANDKYPTSKHSTLSDYKRVLDDKDYNSMYKFATIRNPWDRMISLYFSPRVDVPEWNRELFIFIVHTHPTLRQYICESWSTERVDSNIDFLMRFEDIDSDFKAVSKILDIPLNSLAKRNASTRRHYSEYYDEELKEIVGEKFKEEIEYGNYKFEYA